MKNPWYKTLYLFSYLALIAVLMGTSVMYHKLFLPSDGETIDVFFQAAFHLMVYPLGLFFMNSPFPPFWIIPVNVIVMMFVSFFLFQGLEKRLSKPKQS